MLRNFLLRSSLIAGIALSAIGHVQAAKVTVLHIVNDEIHLKELQAVEAAFEKANPGIEVELEFLENQSFKSKLTTLLQSKNKPDIFFSWGGGVFREQAEAGVLKDISKEMNGGWSASLSPAGVDGFSHNGKVYGSPYYMAQVGFWYNKALLKKAGVDEASLSTWSGFLEGVKKLKAAGITPIALGASEKWPTHFYWSYLALRNGGKAALLDAMADKGKGFASEPFIKAGEDLLKLVKLKPFQNGFQGQGYGEASGIFGNGKAAFHLMGDWDYNVQKQNSESGKGLDDKDLGFMPFPTVKGGKGDAKDTMGGINGWAVTKDASPEAVKFLEFLVNKDNQTTMATQGVFIPVAKGAETGIKNPYMAQIARHLAESQYHMVFLDQLLGADVGQTVNDVSSELASESITPKAAAERVQESWADR